MGKYIKSKSNYTYKSKHQRTLDGTIFERDYMTISASNGFPKDGAPIYGDSNFKFVVRGESNQRTKHKSGNWVINDAECNEDVEKQIWTSECLSKKKDNKEEFFENTAYKSLSDFACYGSAVEMVRSSVTDIIRRFPAELYFTNQKLTLDNKVYFIVENDYEIDLDTDIISDKEEDIYLERYLSKNFQDYRVIKYIDGEEQYHFITGYTVDVYSVSCEETLNGVIRSEITLSLDDTSEIKMFVYENSGSLTILHEVESLNGVRVRPNDNVVYEFFRSLDKFQRVILNRTSNPMYSAIFETKRWTDEGISVSLEDYTWPNKHGWNPDITSYLYNSYIERLYYIAKFCDDYDSDNIWRSMTHEAIKNLDWTFSRQNGEVVNDIETIDTSKIEPILKVYGRQYDDLKGYIDSIKNTNKITYDGVGNLPDKLFGDNLSLFGIAIKNVSPTNDRGLVTDVLYSGMDEGYGIYDINVEFLRRLKMNARYLQSIKGTTDGIKTMLALFGYVEGTDDCSDYTLSEYVEIAKANQNGYHDFVSGETLEYILYPTLDNVSYINSFKDNFPPGDSLNDDILYGLPLKGVSLSIDNPSGETKTYSYVVPWFDKDKTYDKELYFQMYGGWGKQNKKVVNTNVSPINLLETTNIYDETMNWLKITNNLGMLLEIPPTSLKQGDICFVEDITNINDVYTLNTGDTNDYSHYFVLENLSYSTVLGYQTTVGTYGWRCINNSEIESGATDDGRRVVYLESLIEEKDGNNPHLGGVMYDDGKEYIRRIANPFSESEFSRFSDEYLEWISGYSFDVSEVEDNDKCHYFVDTNSITHTRIVDLEEEYGGYYVQSTGTTSPMCFEEAYNPESGDTCDEASANSIINTKKIVLNFKIKDDDNKLDNIKFISDIVLFYVKQMIPSTALFQYNFEFVE